MKNRPIHQNLDTSFVNLSALVKYLRRRQFKGNVKVQLNGYMADIHILKDNQMKVSEHDQISGRISTGEEALQRILIRAREPGGSINVYQLVSDDVSFEEPKHTVEPKIQYTKLEEKTELIIDAEIIHPIPEHVQPSIEKNGSSTNGTYKIQNVQANGASLKPEKLKEPPKKKSKPIKREKTLPDFPFSLTNKVEAQAKQKPISNEEWQTLLKLTVEILGVVDKTLAQADLDFSAAFRKACTEVSSDYPFLNPSSGVFDYKQGKIKMTEKVNEKIFITSITETLRRILEKLESNPKFENLHRQTSQTLIALMNKRKSHYDKFSITPHFNRILGI